MSAANTFDIVISGGGIAGLSIALALNKLCHDNSVERLRIAVIETQDQPIVKQQLATHIDDVAPRVSALSQASQQFLISIGAWKYVPQVRTGDYHAMHVWDANGNAAVEFNASDVNQAALGCIVENQIVIAALFRALSDTEITLLQPDQLQQLQRHEDNGWELMLTSGRRLHAELLIAADGANSFIRQQLQLPTREWDYPHHAIVATVETQLMHQHTAWQCFLDTGPLAFLPINSQNNCLSSVVWSLTPECADRLLNETSADFAMSLERAFEKKLGRVKLVSKRFSFPLRQMHALDYVDHGVALIADAAHVVHPLAGQGINLGLQDARVLAEEIARAKHANRAWSSKSVLLRYQRRRKTKNLEMMAAVEVFARLFTTDDLSIAWLRNQGMKLFANVPALKRKAIKKAMGI